MGLMFLESQVELLERERQGELFLFCWQKGSTLTWIVMGYTTGGAEKNIFQPKYH